MSTAFNVGIDLLGESDSAGIVNAQMFPNLSYAVHRMLEHGQEMWRGYALGEALPDGSTIHPRTGRYARSIHIRHRGDFGGYIASGLPYAASIEHGMPARDMKKMLNTSLKVRVSKKGHRYLIIPFRWGTPGSSTLHSVMPETVHAMWRGPSVKRSRITGHSQRVSGTGAWGVITRRPIKIHTRKYKWGKRLADDDLRAAGVFGRKAKHMKGMVNFRAHGKGGASHSQYLTFRVMSENSKGWIAKATPGKWPARTTAERLQPIAEVALQKAVENDIRSILG